MRYSRTLPLCSCVVVAAWSRADHYAVVFKVAKNSQTDGPKVGEGVFGKSGFAILGDVFDFWFFGFYRFYIFLTNIIKTYIKI